MNVVYVIKVLHLFISWNNVSFVVMWYVKNMEKRKERIPIILPYLDVYVKFVKTNILDLV